MARITSAIVLIASFWGALALPKNSPRQLKGFAKRVDLPPAEDRAQAVVDTFRTAWEGYYEYAFPNDELKPVSNGFSNSR
jgi:mannosyl-oligosaccharide alpha-1,2-mannosidase